MIDENTPQSYRHRLPQERRTPEVYGRAALLNSRQQQPIGPPPQQPPGQQQQQQVRPYEDVFNANTRPPLEIPTGADNFSEQQHRHFQQQQHFKQQQQQQFIPQQGYPPHMHAQQEQNRFYDPNLSQQMPNNTNNSNSRQFQQFQGQHQQQQQQQHHQQQIHPEQLAALRQARPASTVERVPRPHSADFLEYERQFGPQQDAGPGPVGVPHRGQNSHHRLPNRPQPPRPKSSIEQRIPSELRRQMIEQQNVEEGLIRLSTTTPTPRLNNNLSHNNKNNNNNSFAYAQQQMQMLHLENSSNQIVDNVSVNNNNNNNNVNVQNVPRAPTTPRQPETSTPNYRNRPQKMNYNVRNDTYILLHYYIILSFFAYLFHISVTCRNQIKTDKVPLA